MSLTSPHGPAAPEVVATSSSVVYRNRWMTVREDITRYPDGSPGLYGVIEKPDFALVIPYADGGFHLVEQYRYAVGGRYWEFPMGCWEDRPDADPLELAHGELREETGLTAGRMERIGYFYQAYGFCDHGCNVFVATDLTPGPQQLDATEAGLVSRWFSEAELWGLVAEGRFRDAVSLAGLALFQRERAEGR